MFIGRFFLVFLDVLLIVLVLFVAGRRVDDLHLQPVHGLGRGPLVGATSGTSNSSSSSRSDIGGRGRLVLLLLLLLLHRHLVERRRGRVGVGVRIGGLLLDQFCARRPRVAPLSELLVSQRLVLKIEATN